MINIGKFHQFIEDNFNIKELKRKVQDARKRPIILPMVVTEISFVGEQRLTL